MQSDLNRSQDGTDAATVYDVLAGTIIGAHGVQGGVKIKMATGTALSMLRPADNSPKNSVPVWLGRFPSTDSSSQSGDQLVPARIARIKQVKTLQPGGRVVLAKVVGISERNGAEELVGLNVYAPKERRAKLAEDEYFTEDLIGLEVVSEGGRKFGKIAQVLSEPGNDVYETNLGALIPAVKAVIKKIDLKARAVTVEDFPGLFPSEADEVASGRDDTAESSTEEA